MSAPASQRRPLRALAGLAGGLCAVLLAAAALLAGLDAVPAWVNGESRDVKRATSLEDAERRLRARLVLPAYFPDTLAWPPEKIRVLRGVPPAVALSFTAREGGAVRLVLAQTIGPGPVPERLLPLAGALDESPVQVGRAEGALRRVVGDDGEIWREVSWTQDGRSLVARSKGGLEELLRMVRSAREQP